METIFVSIIVSTVTLVLGAILSVIGFLGMRVLKSIDLNQKNLMESLKELWQSHDRLSQDFHEIKGEHRINHIRSGKDRRQREDNSSE